VLGGGGGGGEVRVFERAVHFAQSLFYLVLVDVEETEVAAEGGGEGGRLVGVGDAAGGDDDEAGEVADREDAPAPGQVLRHAGGGGEVDADVREAVGADLFGELGAPGFADLVALAEAEGHRDLAELHAVDGLFLEDLVNINGRESPHVGEDLADELMSHSLRSVVPPLWCTTHCPWVNSNTPFTMSKRFRNRGPSE
jgi:hypothetical protein